MTCYVSSTVPFTHTNNYFNPNSVGGRGRLKKPSKFSEATAGVQSWDWNTGSRGAGPAL